MSVVFSASSSDEKGDRSTVEIIAAKPDESPAVPKRAWILASVVLFVEVSFAVLEGQLTAIGFGETFKAPYFYTFCRFISRSLAFPILFLGMWVYSLCRGKTFQPKEFFWHCAKAAGPGAEGITFIGFIKLFALPTLFALGTGVGYIVALVYVAPSITSACFSAVVALSYILSILFLKQPHLIIKTIFVLFSFTGVTLVAYGTTKDPLQSDAYIGIITVLLSCAALALHQFFYSKSFPNTDSFQSAFIVSVMFGTIVLVFWPVPLATKMLGAEVWSWNEVPWGYLIGGVTSSLCVAFLYAYGLAVSNPFFMSLGELLNLAMAGLVDYFVRPASPDTYAFTLSGFAIIAVSFVVLLLPDKILSIDVKGFFNKLSKKNGKTFVAQLHPSESRKNLVGASNESSTTLATSTSYTD